jgi:hypothetical protein
MVIWLGDVNDVNGINDANDMTVLRTPKKKRGKAEQSRDI